MTSKKILNNLKNNYSQYFILFFYVFRMTGKRSWNKVSIDTYTCHCEKIEDFRGNPENACVVLDYFVTAFLVMTKPHSESIFQ